MLSGRLSGGRSSLGGVGLVTMAMSPAEISVMCRLRCISSDGFHAKRKRLILRSAPSVSIDQLSPSKPSSSVPLRFWEEMFTPNQDGIWYSPKRKPASVPASQPRKHTAKIRTDSSAADSFSSGRRFFAGGAGRCSDGILRVPFSVGSVSVGAVSVIMSVSK